MKRIKRARKLRRVNNRSFQILSTIALLCILYFGIKCFVFAAEIAVEQPQDAPEEVVAQTPLTEEALPIVEETIEIAETEEAIEAAVEEVVEEVSQPMGLTDLIPDGVVFDPEGESFVTIDGEVIREGEYYYEFLLESITAEAIVFSDDQEEYEIPVRSLGRMEAIIESFEDIYVDGLLYDAQGESYAVINDTVARKGETIGGFLVEDIRDSQVVLKKDDLRFEVTIPHFDEEARKKLELPQPDTASLTDVQATAAPRDTGAVPMAMVE